MKDINKEIQNVQFQKEKLNLDAFQKKSCNIEVRRVLSWLCCSEWKSRNLNLPELRNVVVFWGKKTLNQHQTDCQEQEIVSECDFSRQQKPDSTWVSAYAGILAFCFEFRVWISQKIKQNRENKGNITLKYFSGNNIITWSVALFLLIQIKLISDFRQEEKPDSTWVSAHDGILAFCFEFRVWNFEFWKQKNLEYPHPEYKADRQKQMLKSDSSQTIRQNKEIRRISPWNISWKYILSQGLG